MKSLALFVVLLATLPTFANPISTDADLCLTRGFDCRLIGSFGYDQGYLAEYFALNDGNYLTTITADTGMKILTLATSAEGFEDVYQVTYLSDLFQIISADPDPPTPEPGTLVLLGTGLIGIFSLARKI